MSEETKKETVVEDNTPDYIAQIEALKNSTVPKEDYERLKADNKRLIETVASRKAPTTTETPKEPVDVQKLREDLFGKEHTNLEYAKKTLELRQALMAEGKPDPFLPCGHNVAVEDSDIADAQKVADYIQHAIDVADGDPVSFTMEFQRGLVDSVPTIRGRHNIS